MQYLRITDLVNKVKLSKSEIWQRVKDNNFPQPFSLSKRVTVWDERDVNLWMEEQKKISTKGCENDIK